MDLTPPSLTRSPASPSITYCPSERSSLDYPSPDLVVEQHYRLASIYGDQACSLDAHMDGESLQSDWNTTALHASSASPMPSIISSDYDSFGSYPYSHDVYQTPHSGHHTPSLQTSTPPPTGTSRSPIPSSRLSFASSAGSYLPGAPTPRIKMEPADYGQNAELSHYPSPRSVHTSYPSDAGGAYTSNSGGYLSDDGSSSWHEPDSNHFYPGASSSSSLAAAAFLQQQDSSRRSYPQQQQQQHRIAPAPQAQRPRRAQRRLTTKEEANFQCEVKGCGKLFSRSYNFKAHMETHDDKREYPFPCTVGDCAKKFVRKTDLQRHHQSVHMRERNHKCDFCSRLFARKDTLRRYVSLPPPAIPQYQKRTNS